MQIHCQYQRDDKDNTLALNLPMGEELRELVLPLADHIAPFGYPWSRCGDGIRSRLRSPFGFKQYYRLRLNGTALAHERQGEGLVGDRRGLDSCRLCESSANRGNAELSRRRNPEYLVQSVIEAGELVERVRSLIPLTPALREKPQSGAASPAASECQLFFGVHPFVPRKNLYEMFWPRLTLQVSEELVTQNTFQQIPSERILTMKEVRSGFQRLFRQSSVVVLLASIVIGQITNVQAQKLPPMLGTSANDPSAFDMESVRKIKADYDLVATSTTDVNREKAKELRNRLIGIGREQVDAMYFSYIKSDRKKRQLLQFLLDFLEIGAATAISLTNGERARTVISEGLGAVQASRTSLNKNFQLLERQMLINKMAADRATILTSILSKRELDVAQYPWEDARADLRTYRDSGTLDTARSSLSSDIGKQRFDAEETLRVVKDKPITAAATEEDHAAADGASAVRSKLRKALNDSNDTSRQTAATKTLQKIVGKLQEDKAIADLLNAKDISPTTEDGAEILDALRDIREILISRNRRDLVRKINLITAEVGNQ
jgi:hypothetical protein